MLVVLHFMLEEVLLPVVGPGFAERVPCARARLWFIISYSRDIVLAILTHIDIGLPKQLLVSCKKVRAESLSKLLLKIKPVLVPENVS